jgi:RHS repeat-associated protein
VTGATATYSYNPDSQVTGISYGSGKDSQSFGYDPQHRLTSDTLKTSSGTAMASESYGYNADSEVTSENTTGLAGAASNTYTYDEAGRLASWNNGSTATAYGYDKNGNLTQSGSKTYTYDARDELAGDGTSSYAYTARGTPSAEPGAAGGTLAASFDAYGDQMTAGTRAYAYDALGRLTGDTVAGGPSYAFTYAGSSGALASDGFSTYTWDPSGSVLAGTGTAGGGTSGVQALTDAHTNLVGQFTAAGTSVSGSKAYDPWGTVTATTGTVSGLLGYQSAWSDAASGKDLMGARWYDPGAGDFTSRDTVAVSPDPDPAAGNPFAYAADEPLDLTDPSGHMVVNLPSDYGSTPEQSHAVITTAQQAAARAGALAQAQKQATALEAAAKKTKTAAAVKAAAAAEARAQTAAAALKVSVAAKAAAAKAQTAAAKAAAARAAQAAKTQLANQNAKAQKTAALNAQITKQQRLAQQVDDRIPADKPAPVNSQGPAYAPGCSSRLLQLGACPSESQLAGSTPAQVKQSLKGAGLVLASTVPVGDIIGLVGAGSAVPAARTVALDADTLVKFRTPAVQAALKAGDRLVATPNVVSELVNSVGVKDVANFLGVRGVEAVDSVPGASVPASALRNIMDALVPGAQGNAGDALNIAEAAGIDPDLFLTNDVRTIGKAFGLGGSIDIPFSGGIKLPFQVVLP